MGARADFEASLAWFEGTHPSHPDTAMASRRLGEQLDFDGHPARSERMPDTRLRDDRSDAAPGPPRRWLLLEGPRARAGREAGDLVSARELRERGLSIAEQALGRDHPRVAMQLNDLANTSLLQGEFAAARSLYERARETYERRQGPDNNGATAAVYNLALMATQLGDYEEARRGLERVIGTWTRVLGPEHPDVARGLVRRSQRRWPNRDGTAKRASTSLAPCVSGNGRSEPTILMSRARSRRLRRRWPE